MIQPLPHSYRATANRKRKVITVRLDQPTRDRINRRIPSDYRTVSALVRAGIDEILTSKDSTGRRIDR